MSPRLARTRVTLLIVAGVLLLGIAGLGWQAARTAEREQVLLHQAVAERVFDELERELTELIRIEEARPFGHWRHLYVPNDQVLGNALATSPLAPLPLDPHIVGYFQFDPDGTLRSPHVLGPDEATQNGLSADPTPEAMGRVALLADLTHDVTGFEDRTPPPVRPRRRRARVTTPEPAPTTKPAPTPMPEPDPTTASLAPDLAWNQALNNASAPRLQRVEQRVQAPAAQVRNFAPTNPMVTEPPPPVEPTAAPTPALPPRAPPRRRPLPQSPERQLDVVIAPITVAPGPDNTVRFSRTVRIDTQTWVQGVVFRRVPLQRWLQQRAMGAGSFDHIELSWATPFAGPYTYTHTFDEPFSDWAAHIAVAPAPTDGPSPRQTVLGLAALAMAATLAGLFAAYRTVVASVAWASQRENFVAAVTHELKTPLTAIQMYSEMLAEGVVDDPERTGRYHRTIHDEATRLARLVDDVLQFSSGEPRPRTSPTGTAGDAISRALTLAEAHGGLVTADIHDEAATWPVPTDLVVQVLTNLLDNAVKFGGGSPVDVSAQVASRRLQIDIADRGPGVDPTFLTQMFEPFVRSETARQQETRGTGLGLALVRSMVRAIGGRVQARLRTGGGLVVTVVLPARNGAFTER